MKIYFDVGLSRFIGAIVLFLFVYRGTGQLDVGGDL